MKYNAVNNTRWRRCLKYLITGADTGRVIIITRRVRDFGTPSTFKALNFDTPEDPHT